MLAVAGIGGTTAPPAAAAGPPLKWTALGDSYSAGTGLGPVTPDCDRDPFAYAPRAARDLLASSYTTDLRHTACSGARIADVWDSQLGSVSAATRVATLTVSGNDIGFGAKLGGCWTTCGPDTMALQADVPGGTQTWDDVYDGLVTTYVAVRRRMAADGQLYVLTYPIPFARQSSGSCQGLSSLEQNAANALVTRLDDTIYWAVRRANELLPDVHGRAGNVHFVDWRTGTRQNDAYAILSGLPDSGRTFASYVSPDGLCNTSGQTPYLNGFVDNAPVNPDRGNSFHPNSTGYWAAAVLVASHIRRDVPASP